MEVPMKRNVPVTKIMTADPLTAHTGQSLSEVRKAMADGGFHHMPIVSGTQLIGVLSSTDLLTVSYQYGADERQQDAVLDHTVSIEALMNREPTTLTTESTVREAAEILVGGKFHSLPVVDDDGQLAGLITTGDLIRYHLDQY